MFDAVATDLFDRAGHDRLIEAVLARRLAEQGLLRPGVTPEEAADVLWLLTSFESFDLMYSGRGMPVDAIVTTLVTTAERTLYDRPDREAVSPV